VSHESHAFIASALCGVGLCLVSYQLALVVPLPRPVLGHRGIERARALRGMAAFRALEPVMRFIAALSARVPVPGPKAWLESRLTRAGEFLGLSADEYLALTLLAAAGSSLAAAALLHWLALSPLWLVAGFVLGAAWPLSSVHGQIKHRQRRVTRQLPAAIDLLALCMHAGLDFAGALELLCRELHDARDPLVVECNRLLEQLALGRTRAEALAGLAARVQTDPVRDFTTAVIQAEQKGHPLAEVLAIQARMLRMHRSVAAEEGAARASVLLVLPMMLLLCAVLLVMMGPFIVNGFKLS
jgi:tight adherence protein C